MVTVTRVAQCAGERATMLSTCSPARAKKDVAGEGSFGSGRPVCGELDPGSVDAFLDLEGNTGARGTAR
jgi:hypothetical protein